MLTYILLAVPFLAFSCLFFITTGRKITRQWVGALSIILLMTAIFDSLIIYAGIVSYDYEKLLGITIGNVPIEDFAYSVAALLLVPSFWHLTKPKERKE